jgi:hypothetical protein
MRLKNGSKKIERHIYHNNWQHMHHLTILFDDQFKDVLALRQVFAGELLGPGSFLWMAYFLDFSSVFAPCFNQWLPSKIGW